MAVLAVGDVEERAAASRVEGLGGEVVELGYCLLTPTFLETDCIMLLSYSPRDCSIIQIQIM